MDSDVWGKSIFHILKEEKLKSKTDFSFFQKKSPRSLTEYALNPSFYEYLGAVLEMNGHFRFIQKEEIEEDGFQNAIEKMTHPGEQLSPLKMYEAQ